MSVPQSTPVSSGQGSTGGYELRISRLTVDKLGVKLYDKVSAVVSELVANAYDADAENVVVRLPLSKKLASNQNGKLVDAAGPIEIQDDGHGMTPEEARQFYLRVGADRRQRKQLSPLEENGNKSRKKHRPVMGRKGIGKLAPFGICKKIEVRSAGGSKTDKGYQVTHFYLDFEKILTDSDMPVPLDVGADDGTWDDAAGTLIRLSGFLNKIVPSKEEFGRQMASRFYQGMVGDFHIHVLDTNLQTDNEFDIKQVDIPLLDGSRIDVSEYPISLPDGRELHVSGWMGMARKAYKNPELAGVRIYARNKIVASTRDFNQPSGFTGEFAVRSYLVGAINAEWIDEEDDLVRTDRQDILWDSEYGQAFRIWGARLVKKIAQDAKAPRRKRVADIFIEKSNFSKKVEDLFYDKSIKDVALDLAKKIGAFAAEDELGDNEFVNDLANFVLTAAPQQALLNSFKGLAKELNNGRDVDICQVNDIFNKANIAQLAAYAQIASQRLRVIENLEKIVNDKVDEKEFQSLLTEAPWLIAPSWSMVTSNQALKTLRDKFQREWNENNPDEQILLAISYEDKRPDFVLASLENTLHIVEIKRSGYHLKESDIDRLSNYVSAFESFFAVNSSAREAFPNGWKITLVVDGVGNTDSTHKFVLDSFVEKKKVEHITWFDFLMRAKKVHEEFLEAQDRAKRKDVV